MKIDLDHWSEAEMDFTSARDVLSVLNEAMFADGADKVYTGAVWAAYRLIDSGLGWVDSGKYPNGMAPPDDEDTQNG